MTFKDFQNWYCAKFQRNNPLPWQDGMQALLWYITEALPANTRATLSITSAPTGVTITGDGTDSSPYVWAFNLNRTEADDITAEKLFDIIKGSETVVVDISEDGTTLEVHLDADVINKLDRALLTPVSPPAEPAAVVINTAGAQELKPLSEIGGGGGLYKHRIVISNITSDDLVPDSVTVYIDVISARSTPYTQAELTADTSVSTGGYFLAFASAPPLGGPVGTRVCYVQVYDVAVYIYPAEGGSEPLQVFGGLSFTDTVTGG